MTMDNLSETKFGEGLLEAMIPSLECYYQLHANKKT